MRLSLPLRLPSLRARATGRDRERAVRTHSRALSRPRPSLGELALAGSGSGGPGARVLGPAGQRGVLPRRAGEGLPRLSSPPLRARPSPCPRPLSCARARLADAPLSAPPCRSRRFQEGTPSTSRPRRPWPTSSEAMAATRSSRRCVARRRAPVSTLSCVLGQRTGWLTVSPLPGPHRQQRYRSGQGDPLGPQVGVRAVWRRARHRVHCHGDAGGPVRLRRSHAALGRLAPVPPLTRADLPRSGTPSQQGQRRLHPHGRPLRRGSRRNQQQQLRQRRPDRRRR